MNRTIALFVGLALLLAHTLTIHDTVYDDFAPPYELAHVAYRLARNLVYGDGLQWSPGQAGFDAYPSPLWVAISAFGQRAYLGVNVFSQTVGIISALSTADRALLVPARARGRSDRAAPAGGQRRPGRRGRERHGGARSSRWSRSSPSSRSRIVGRSASRSRCSSCARRGPEGVVFALGFAASSPWCATVRSALPRGDSRST